MSDGGSNDQGEAVLALRQLLRGQARVHRDDEESEIVMGLRLECAVCIEVNDDGVSENVVVIKAGYSLCADHEQLIKPSEGVYADAFKKAKATR